MAKKVAVKAAAPKKVPKKIANGADGEAGMSTHSCMMSQHVAWRPGPEYLVGCSVIVLA